MTFLAQHWFQKHRMTGLLGVSEEFGGLCREKVPPYLLISEFKRIGEGWLRAEMVLQEAGLVNTRFLKNVLEAGREGGWARVAESPERLCAPGLSAVKGRPV